MSEEDCQVLILSAHNTGSVGHAQVVRLAGKLLHRLGLLTNPCIILTYILHQMAQLVKALAATAKPDDSSSIPTTHMRGNQFLNTFHGAHPSAYTP